MGTRDRLVVLSPVGVHPGGRNLTGRRGGIKVQFVQVGGIPLVGAVG